MKSPFLFCVALALVPAGAAIAVTKSEPFYEGLGTYSRKVTTKSEVAQRYFDQGLALLHGFNHGAAIRSFKAAAREDPECAMAHWGIALANGPHINVPMMPPPAIEEAWAELGLARKYAERASPIERELITALASRYASPQPEDRTPLDRAYADAMRKLWQAHPDDQDVGTLFAESVLDLRPWDQWTPDGKPQPGTEEVIATLDAVLKLNVNHPLANHLYIHTVEASSHPERANAAADRLRALQPGLAHNVHMPSHIDIRNGRWKDAITANLKAIDAAKRHSAVAGPTTGPLIIYNAHNEHMLAYAAMMTGQRELAIGHIRAMVAAMPPEAVQELAPVVDAYIAAPYEVLARFGRWDEILAEPEHPEYLPFTRAMRHAVRGVAFAAKHDVEAAKAEQEAYTKAAALVPAESAAGPVPLSTILDVIAPMVAGEILYREGRVDEGIAKLREAVKAEDALRYFEPPAWFLPVRHALGATLMKERRFADAEQVYRDDLGRYPENGWSLLGLTQSLRGQGREEEAVAVNTRFQKIWSDADTRIASSCLCQPDLKLAAE